MSERKIQSEAQLSFWEATGIIIGHGVGSGILSIPYLASRNNIWTLFLVMIVVYGINLLLHFMIAELSLNNGGAQFIKCFEAELFVGKAKKILTYLAFALLGFSVIVNISGFISGAGAVFTAWFGLPPIVSKLIFYVAAAAVVFVGMKLVGICEKIAVFSMAIVIGILVVATVLGGMEGLQTQFVAYSNVLALFSMVSFALSAVMSVPQVVKGLGGNTKRIKASIATGTGLNLLLILVITMTTLLGVGKGITENGALVDLAQKLGGWVGIVGYVFSLLALATSFWANALNLRDIISEQIHINKILCFVIATVPSLVIALFGFTSFVGFTRLASVVQVLTGIGVIVAYNRSRRHTGSSAICGPLGTLPFQILVVLSSLAATVGALLSVK